MKRFFPIAAVLALVLSSCTTELDQVLNSSRIKDPSQKTVFYASTEVGQPSDSPSTKVYADENMKVLWNEGDQITIFNKITYNHGFEFDGEDGDTAGGFEQFTDEPTGFYTVGDLDYFYAVYPYNTGTKINNSGQMTVMLPSEQSYKENSFGIGANTMVAVSDSPRLKFKNVGGYLSLRLYGDNVKVSRVTIKGNNGEKIAGKAKVTIPFGGVPTTVMDNTATDEVSIVCDPPVQIGTDAEHYTDFWFVIPPVTFSGGFTITVTDELGGTFVMTTTRKLTVTRNHLDWMNPLEVVPNYDNVFVPFEDANFKAYCVENFDTNEDGEISLAEASTITHIDCGYKRIQSLSGIENFINLTYLDCWGNQLTSLDVSHNTALTYLSCYSNQLTSLDVSGCTALTVLLCVSNQLTSLDVSNNTALTDLRCEYNQLTSLDVSGCTALTSLNCESNQLTSLDVSGCTALDRLGCSSNQLTSLDVTHNTALYLIVCSSNQLTSLDVSNNSVLSIVNCLNNRPEINIYIRNGQVFSSFQHDASAVITGVGTPIPEGNIEFEDSSFKAFCVNLYDLNGDGEISYGEALIVTELNCSDKGIHSLCGIEFFINLKVLGCTFNQLTSLDVSNNTALTGLYCEHNQLTGLDVNNNTALTDLGCSGNQLTSLDVSNNTALTDLCCSGNQLTSLDVSHNTGLTTLYCDSCPYLVEVWLKTGQTIAEFSYDTNVATIKYKD